MSGARCTRSVSLTALFLSSPETATTIMGTTEIFESLLLTKYLVFQFSSNNSLQDSPRLQPQDLQQPGVCRPPLAVCQPWVRGCV